MDLGLESAILFWFILSDDRDRLTRVLQGNGSLFMTGIAEVNTIDRQDLVPLP